MNRIWLDLRLFIKCNAESRLHGELNRSNILLKFRKTKTRKTRMNVNSFQDRENVIICLEFAKNGQELA